MLINGSCGLLVSFLVSSSSISFFGAPITALMCSVRGSKKKADILEALQNKVLLAGRGLPALVVVGAF